MLIIYADHVRNNSLNKFAEYRKFPWRRNHFGSQGLYAASMSSAFTLVISSRQQPSRAVSSPAAGGYRTFEYVLGDKSIYPPYADTPYDY